MLKLKLKMPALIALSVVFLIFAQQASGQENSDERFRISFNDETNLTTVVLKGIEIPNNKDSFAVGALFQFVGEKLENEPCCVQIFLTSLSEKKFKYKEDHDLTVWADKDKIEFGQINWQESPGGTAFIISGMFYPEEMFVGMERDKFVRIANAKKIRIKIGKSSFKLTSEQLGGLRQLSLKMMMVGEKQ